MSTSLTSTNKTALAIAATDVNALKTIRTWDDLENFSKLDVVADFIKSTSKTYYTINVAVAMKELSGVGKLLQAAYAGTKTRDRIFKSNAEIAVILSNYMSLVKTSSVTSTSFVEASLYAINIHRLAIKKAADGKPEKALEVYLKCCTSAKKMAEESEKLVLESDKLLTLSTQALKSATEDAQKSSDDKAKVQKMIEELEAKKVSLETTTDELHELIEEEKKNEKDARERAEAAEGRAFVLGIVSAIAQPVGSALGAVAKVGVAACAPQAAFALSASADSSNEGNTVGIADDVTDLTRVVDEQRKKLLQESDELKQKRESAKDENEKNLIDEKLKAITEEGKALSEKLEKLSGQEHEAATDHRSNEMEIAARRAAYQKEMIQQNADLKKSLKLLASSQSEENSIEQAIQALEISVKALGRIITIFGNAKKFWLGVQKHCEHLVENRNIAEVLVDDEDEFIEEMKHSALYWISLGNITRIAALAIAKVDKGVDEIMINLPTREESSNLVQSLSKEMIETLDKEDKYLLEN